MPKGLLASGRDAAEPPQHWITIMLCPFWRDAENVRLVTPASVWRGTDVAAPLAVARPHRRERENPVPTALRFPLTSFCFLCWQTMANGVRGQKTFSEDISLLDIFSVLDRITSKRRNPP